MKGKPQALWVRWSLVWLAATLLWLGVLVFFTNCSHTTPYRARVPAPYQAGEPSVRVLLLGDAGRALYGSPVLRAARDVALEPAGRTVAVYLGDNVYPNGLPAEGDPERAHGEATLLAQLGAFEGTGAEVYFTPGNHDWAQGSEHGVENLVRQREFIAKNGRGKARLLPGDGSPGPVCVDEGELRLVFVDTQWWLHEHERPEASVEDVKRELAACLEHSPALLATHHPPRTHGVHGNYFTWQDHVFPLTRLRPWAYLPLPLIGSLYPLTRSFGVSAQDIEHGTNRRMVEDLGGVLKRSPPLAWVAGHEHNLQVLEGAPLADFTLVSGAASKVGAVTDDEDTVFAHEALGFMEIQFFPSRAPLLVVHSEVAGVVRPTFRHVLESEPGRGLPP